MTPLMKVLCSWLLLVSVSPVWVPAQAGEGSPVTVTFDRPIHFTRADGDAVKVEAAAYLVERQDATLRLTPQAGGKAIVLPVEPLPFDMSVEEPTVLSLMRNGDDHLLLYADRDGTVMGITGTYSGIRTRDIATVRPSVISPTASVPLQLPGGNILPGVPRLKSVSAASFANGGMLVPFANANVSITLYNLPGPAGTRISYRVVSPGSITGQSQCTITRNPRILVADSFQIDQNGEGRIGVPGWFTTSGSCAVGVELMLPGKSEPVRLVAGPIQVLAPVRYTLSGTSNLRARLGFRATSSLGICEGTSIGPTNYPVGIVNNGADLAFRIRSGPIGTECQFISNAWLLPDGVRLVSTTWEQIREIPSGQEQGKCCVVNAFGHNCITMPPHAGANFTRGTAPIVTGQHAEAPSYYSVTSSDRQILEDGVVIKEIDSPRVVTVIKPMWGKLQCTNTVVNDHGVKLVLRELILEGPSGLTFP
ncbi:MAG: hypothetical protein ICV75_07165 [Nitrospiraceae bacterium]|nr:hypothetical protein [Nitrospiraceae bacterium]